jgi:hypothetical protein
MRAQLYDVARRLASIVLLRLAHQLGRNLPDTVGHAIHDAGAAKRFQPPHVGIDDGLRVMAAGLLQLDQMMGCPVNAVPSEGGDIAVHSPLLSRRLDLAAQIASKKYPDLASMSVSPHLVRHGTAMSLLQSGAHPSEIALWLGHESPATTHMYVEADLAMKERTLARLKAPEIKPTRYRPPRALMAFLQTL